MKLSLALSTLCLASVLSFSCAKSPSKPTINAGLPSADSSVRTSTQTSLREIWTRNIAETKILRVSKTKVETSTSVTLTSLIHRQGPSLIQVFATYCPPCLREIPGFNALYANKHSILGLSLDASNHAGLVKIMREHQPEYPVAVISNEGLDAISRNLDGLPMTLVLDTNKQVVKILYGLADEETLRAQLKAQ